MNITQEKINDLNAVVKIKIAPEDYTEKVDKSIKEQAKKATLPGFRKGMVPAAHIKKMYGRSILVEEINNLLSETLNKHLTDNKVEILGQPLPVMDDTKEFKWDYTDEFEFDYELGLAPAIDVNITAKDKFTKYVVKADEETLAARVKNIRKSYGKMTNPEVSAEEDVIYAELAQLSADGSVFEGGITQTGSIRLDQVTDKKILKSLIGLKKDDVAELDVQKAFDKNEVIIAKLLNISEEDAKDLQSKFRVAVKNVNLYLAGFAQPKLEKVVLAVAVRGKGIWNGHKRTIAYVSSITTATIWCQFGNSNGINLDAAVVVGYNHAISASFQATSILAS